MLSDLSYSLLLITVSLNTSTLNVEQLVLESILQSQGYLDTFCGTLIAHSYFFGTFFMLMGATWVDNSANYVKVSRIASLICAFSIATFNISILLPDIKSVILVTNVLASFGCSLMYPALLQVSLRSAVTILPEATVAAIVVVLQQCIAGLLMNLLGPLKRLSIDENSYQGPLMIFTSFIVIINISYAAFFEAPSREKLQGKLGPNFAQYVTPDTQLSIAS